MNTLLNYSGEVATIEVLTGHSVGHQHYTVEKTWAQLSEGNKEDIASEWIKDHIHTRVNQVMELLAQNEDHCDFEEYQSIAQSKDYSEVSTDHINDLNIDEMIELIEEYGLEYIDVDNFMSEYKNVLTKEIEEEHKDNLQSLIMQELDLEQYGKDNSLDPDYREAYEFWSVSDHFVSMLQDSEKCSKDILGLSVWARYCAGQGIDLDCAIQKAAFKVLSDCSHVYY